MTVARGVGRAQFAESRSEGALRVRRLDGALIRRLDAVVCEDW